MAFFSEMNALGVNRPFTRNNKISNVGIDRPWREIAFSATFVVLKSESPRADANFAPGYRSVPAVIAPARSIRQCFTLPPPSDINKNQTLNVGPRLEMSRASRLSKYAALSEENYGPEPRFPVRGLEIATRSGGGGFPCANR